MTIARYKNHKRTFLHRAIVVFLMQISMTPIRQLGYADYARISGHYGILSKNDIYYSQFSSKWNILNQRAYAR
jgi:hypothetical protein